MPEIDLKLIERANELLPEKVILHIGMTKAGSTAIQNVFEKNYEYLFNQGVLFPKSVFSRKNPYAQNRTSGHLQLVRDIRASNLEDFIAELERARGQIDRIFLSAENLFQDVNDGDLQHLARLLKGKALEIVVIFRSQTDWLPSRFYQSVTGGDKREWQSFDRFVDTMIEEGQLNYYERLKFVAAILNADNVVAFDYDQIKKQGGTIAVIAGHLGLKEEVLGSSLSEPENNISLPLPEALEAHRRLNMAASHLPPDAYQSWCSEMESMISDFARQRKLRFSHIRPDRQLRKRIIETCIEPNLKLSRELLAGKPFGPKKSSIRSKDPEPLDESIVNQVTMHGLELMAPYIQRLRSEAGQERSRATRLKSGLDSARKQPALLSAQITKLAGQLSAANEKIVKLQEKYATASSNYDQQKKQTATISKSLAVTEQALESTREKLSATVEERDSLKARVANLTDELATVNHDKSVLSTELKAAKKENLELKRSHKEFQARSQRTLRKITAERDSFVRYSDELEVRFLRVLRSRTWRMLGPYRVVIRKMRSYLRGRRVPPNSLPKRPKLHTNSDTTEGTPEQQQPSRGKRMPLQRSAVFASRSNRHDKTKVEIQIQALRKRMLNLGFIERAKEELIELANDASVPYRQQLAANELAVWHLNQTTQDDARKALEYLSIVSRNASDPTPLRKARILAAEAYHRLGDKDKSRHALSKALKQSAHADTFLALSNLETEESAKAKLINQALHLQNLSDIYFSSDETKPLYDRLSAIVPDRKNKPARAPLISVIMPAYNSEKTIRTALNSILAQTWENLELVVVDDCSTDNTIDVVEEYCNSDSRVRLIRARENAGPYVARNLALRNVDGEFVTCNDADDWSHPQKLELQARNLIENKNVMANQSQQARATSDMHFYRRGNSGLYIFSNMSSLMFRREKVLAKLGCWDSVRFGADAEFIRRIQAVFGKSAMTILPTGPTSFQRQSSDSLTGDSAFGYHGFYMGARQEYFERQCQYHKSALTLKYDFPQHKRPFPVPEPMLPEYSSTSRKGRRFDFVIAHDFRQNDTELTLIFQKIKCWRDSNFNVGLVQISEYALNPNIKINNRIRQLCMDPRVDLVVYGEKISCAIAIIFQPSTLCDFQHFIPDLIADRVIVNSDQNLRPIAAGTPQHGNRISQYFGESATWALESITSADNLDSVLDKYLATT